MTSGVKDVVAFFFVVSLVSLVDVDAVSSTDDGRQKSTSARRGRRLSVSSLSYSVDEEQPQSTLVGHVGRDSGVCRNSTSNSDSPLVVHPEAEIDCNGARFTVVGRRTALHGSFALSPLDGVLTTVEPIDRETVCPRLDVVDCSVLLDVAVQTGSDFDIVKVEVIINGINDNPPVFLSSPVIHLSVSESAMPNDPSTIFQLPVATDADGGQNGVAGYRLLQQSDHFRLSTTASSSFGVSDLRLSLTSSLDRESEPEYRLKVVAFDGGRPSLSAILTVVVHVEDADDNSPTFESPTYAVRIPETTAVGAIVAVVRATDPDAGLNGRVRYRLSTRAQGHDDFTVDPALGAVSLRRPLDHGRQSWYRIGILADDEGPVGGVAAFAILTVEVIDENDQAPAVVVHDLTDVDGADELDDNNAGTTKSLRVDVPVGQGRKPEVETFVAYVSARDSDAGENGRVSCSLEYEVVEEVGSTTSLEFVNVNSSDIPTEMAADRTQFVLTPMYEGEFKIVALTNSSSAWTVATSAEYQLTVTCHDHGSPPRTSAIELTVTVAYSSSGPDELGAHGVQTLPTIEFPTTGNDTVVVTDIGRLPVGHVIAGIKAAPLGGNQSLLFELVEGNGSLYFDVDRTSGDVILQRAPTEVPDDVIVLQLVVGVVVSSNPGSLSMATLYVVSQPCSSPSSPCDVITRFPLSAATSSGDTSDAVINERDVGHWTQWLTGERWPLLVGVVVGAFCVVLAALLLAAAFVVCRKSNRSGFVGRRKVASSSSSSSSTTYHVAVEFSAGDGSSVGGGSVCGLNNVAFRNDSTRHDEGDDNLTNIPNGIATKPNNGDGAIQADRRRADGGCGDGKVASMPDILLVDLNPRHVTDGSNSDLDGCHDDDERSSSSTCWPERCTQTNLRQSVASAVGRCARCGLPFRSSRQPPHQASSQHGSCTTPSSAAATSSDTPESADDSDRPLNPSTSFISPADVTDERPRGGKVGEAGTVKKRVRFAPDDQTIINRFCTGSEDGSIAESLDETGADDQLSTSCRRHTSPFGQPQLEPYFDRSGCQETGWEAGRTKLVTFLPEHGSLV